MKNQDTSQSLAKDTRGLSSVEYLILLVVIAVAGISVWEKIGTSVKEQATDAHQKLEGIKSPSDSTSPSL